VRLKYDEHEGEHRVKSKMDSHGVKSNETVTTVNLRASSNTFQDIVKSGNLVVESLDISFSIIDSYGILAAKSDYFLRYLNHGNYACSDGESTHATKLTGVDRRNVRIMEE